jgi:hypothetical protein
VFDVKVIAIPSLGHYVLVCAGWRAAIPYMVPVDNGISVSSLGSRRGSIEDRLKKICSLLEIVMLGVRMVIVESCQYKRPEEPVGNTKIWK